MELKFRTLNESEIECRVNTVKETGCSLLLYKDARCDMNILDETVGPMGWMRSHTRDNSNCTVSIWDEDKGQWISKEDTGTESHTEKEKGLASDSFKRACFNWGIGRELYTGPFIWVPKKNVTLKESVESNGKKKYTTCDKFRVTGITVTDGIITSLKIKNEELKRVAYIFNATECNEAAEAEEKTVCEEDHHEEDQLSEPATEIQKKTIRDVCLKNKVDVDMLYAMNSITENEATQRDAVNLLIGLNNKFGDK